MADTNPDTEVLCTIHRNELAGPLETHPKFEINGRKYVFEYDTAKPVPLFVANAAQAVGYTVTIADSPGDDVINGDAAVGVGGRADGSDTFDANTIVTGTVEQVVAKLGELTIDQLADITAAETAGAKRSGVLTAIDTATAKLASAS